MAERKSILLRLSPEIWREIKVWAEEDLRSLNAQIEFLLREAVLARETRARGGSESGEGRGAEP